MANGNPFKRIDQRFEFLQKAVEEIKAHLIHKDHNQPDDFGGVDLAKSVTGLSIHSVYRLVCERKIPHSKRGNRLYFSRKELEKWIIGGSRTSL